MTDLIDRCARAAYEACMTLRSDPDQPYQPWETLPDRWQRIYRVQAEAVRGVLLAESDIADEPVVADPDLGGIMTTPYYQDEHAVHYRAQRGQR